MQDVRTTGGSAALQCFGGSSVTSSSIFLSGELEDLDRREGEADDFVGESVRSR